MELQKFLGKMFEIKVELFVLNHDWWLWWVGEDWPKFTGALGSGVPHSSWANWVGGLLSPQPSVSPAGGSLADARENEAKSSGSQGQSKDGTQWHGQPGDASDGCLVVVEILHLCTEVEAVVLVEERSHGRAVFTQGVIGGECAAGVVSEGSKVDS